MSIENAILLSLLAVRKSGGVWGRFDHGRPGVGVAEWGIIVGATVLLVLVMCISSWRAKRHKAQFLHDSKSRMFGELAEAHRLSRTNRRLLKKLAAAKEVSNVSTLFVEPEFFEAEKLPQGLEDSARDYQQLRHELFEK